jgi:hypothetical protein
VEAPEFSVLTPIARLGYGCNIGTSSSGGSSHVNGVREIIAANSTKSAHEKDASNSNVDRSAFLSRDAVYDIWSGFYFLLVPLSSRDIGF